MNRVRPEPDIDEAFNNLINGVRRNNAIASLIIALMPVIFLYLLITHRI